MIDYLKAENRVFAHAPVDSGSYSVMQNAGGWLRRRGRVGAKTPYIEPGSPWENGYCESINGTLRDELLNGEISCSLNEARIRASFGALR